MMEEELDPQGLGEVGGPEVLVSSLDRKILQQLIFERLLYFFSYFSFYYYYCSLEEGKD